MRIKSILKPVVLVIVLALCVHAAAPLGFGEENKLCELALDRCLVVAAYLGPVYYAFCLQGYLFCKRYIAE